jgi:hypothetical protein
MTLWPIRSIRRTSMSPLATDTSRHDALANSTMVENRPTPETAKLLRPTSLLWNRKILWIEN